MRAVGIKELKNKLSEYVRIAASGEPVLVTDRGRVVAELNPPRPDRPHAGKDAIMADLIRRGLVTPATNRTGKPPPRLPVATWAELEKELAADREDR